MLATLSNKAAPVEPAAVRGDKVKTYRVVMAGGGTGGHLYPGLSVAAALQRSVEQQQDTLELLWAATGRKVDQHLLSGYGDRYIQQAVQPFPGMTAVSKWPGFWKAWRASCQYWKNAFDRQRVDAVVALGGYAAGPAGYVAAKRGIPVVLLNPDALPGRANRFLFKHSDVVVTQWPMPAAHKKVMALGCPIRQELIGRSRAEAAAMLGIDGTRKTLVVTGASLGAKTINDAVLEMLAGNESLKAVLQTDWQIVHLAGMDQAAAVRAAYAQWPAVQVKVIDYCDDMASIWAVADLAIARAGASTCAELTACGVPSLLLPYPFHKDMHQRANAQELEKAGAALIVNDEKEPKLNAAAIQKVILPLLYDDSRRTQMARAARAIGKPAAADAIAGEILALIEDSSR